MPCPMQVVPSARTTLQGDRVMQETVQGDLITHLKAPCLSLPLVVCPPQPMAMFSSSLSTHWKLPT